MERFLALSRRAETAYLGTLRIVVLIVATIFVFASAFFLIQGASRLATATEVTEEGVKVEPQEALASVATKKDMDGAESSAEAALQRQQKQRYDAFIGGPFAAYYNSYVGLARKYNKIEDSILTREQFAEALGYTLDAYRAGEDLTVVRFVEDAGYASQITASATTLAADKRALGQLQQYKAAQKTAQRCSTDYVSRRMWDSTSTACSNWYESPMGCSVMRQVPVERCVAAYPDGITSPALAFAQMDKSFRTIWLDRKEKNAATAESKRNELLARKASGMPTLLVAAQIFGAFLVVMFIFLVVAIERHLRRLAASASLQGSEPIHAQLRAAE